MVQASVDGDEFNVTWMNDAWAKWALLQESQEMKILIQTAKDRLAKSRATKSKGAGKGQ